MATITTTFKAIDQISPQLSKVSQLLGGIIRDAQNVDGALSGIDGKELQEVQTNAQQAEKSLEELGNEADKTASRMAQIKNASNNLRFSGAVLKGVGGGLESLGRAGMGVTAGLVGMTAGTTKTATNFAKLYQQSNVVFTKMLGDQSKARDMYNSLLDIAKESPFPQENFLEAGKTLVGVGVSAENTSKYLRAISDAVAGFGGDKNNIDQLAFAFRRVATNGRLSMLEVNMMGDDGVNALNILGNHFGKTAEEMRDMVATGVIPANEALDIITKGIEEGSDGVNGYIAALGGMAKAMKGKTLTGAFDSLHTSVRNFALALLDMDPRTESGDKRIRQLTAGVMGLNGIIEKSAPIFKGITEAVGQLLDKLIGTNPVFNEATGQWEQTGGIIQKINDYLANTNPEQLKKVGDHLIRLGVAAPVVLGTGKAVTALGVALDKLSRHREIIERLLNLKDKIKAPSIETEAPDETQTSSTTKRSKTSVSLPDTSTPFKRIKENLQKSGDEIASATDSTSSSIFARMKQSFGNGIQGFLNSIKSSFQNANPDQGLGSFFSKINQSWATKITAFTKVGETVSKSSGSKVTKALSESFKETENGGFLNKTFTKLNNIVNSKGLTFGQQMKNALTNSLPKGDTLGQKVTSLFTNVTSSIGKASKTTGKAFSALVPDSVKNTVTSKLEGIKGVFGKAFGSIGKVLEPVKNLFSGTFKQIGGFLGEFGQAFINTFAGLATKLGPLFSLLGSVASGVMSVVGPLLVLAGGIVLVVSGIGLFAGALGKLGGGMAGIQKVADFFINLNTNISSATTNIVNGVKSWVDNFKQQFPQMAEAGAQMIVQFIMGVARTIPNLISSGITIGLTLITGFLQMLPTIISTGFNVVKSIGDGIIANAPSILTSVQVAVGNIQAAFQENWPLIQQAGGDIFNAIVTGFSMLIPTLWNWVTTAASGIWSTLVTYYPVILQAGCDLISNLVSGLITGIPWLIGQVFSLLGQFVMAIWNNKGQIISAGIGLITGLVTGLYQAIGMIISTAISIGGALINGLIQGISSLWGSLTSFVSTKFTEFIDWVKGIFGVASPSTVFMEIGGFLLEGLRQGLEAAWNGMQGFLSDICNGILNFLNPNKDEANIDYSEIISQTQQQIQQLKDTVANAYTEIKNQTLQVNAEMAQGTISIFQQMSSGVLAQITNMAVQSATIISTIPSQFTLVFQQLFAQTAGYLEQMKNDTLAKVTDMMTNMTGPLGQLTGVFINIFAQINALTLQFLASFQAMAIGAISGLAGALGGALSTLAMGFVGAFNGMVMGCIAALNLLYVTAMSIMTMISTGTLSIIAAMQAGLVGYFSTLTVSVITLTQGMATAVMSAVLLMNTSVMMAATGLYAAYVGIWTTLTATVLGQIAFLTVSALGSFEMLRAGIVGTLITTQFEAVAAVDAMSLAIVTSVQMMIAAIGVALAPMPGMFHSIAVQSMDDFNAGIEERKATVVNTTSDLVTKIKSVFITGLGIHSPSRFMAYIGRMMADGLINGLSRDQIRKFTEAVMDDMRNSFKAGKFDPNELVDYLGKDTEKVIQYLIDTGDNTVGKLMPGVSAVPPIVAAAERYVGYREGGGGFSIFGQRYGNPYGAWCAYFIRAMAEDVGVPFPATGYVPTIMSWARANGRWTQTPQAGYAAIFNGGGHIELVASVDSSGNVTTIGGNTGSPQGVWKRVRNGATGYVALDGGGGNGMGMMTLKDTIQFAYLKKVMEGSVPGVDFSNIGIDLGSFGGIGMPTSFSASGGVQRWTPWVLRALAMLGQPPSLLGDVLYAIQCESGGDPNNTNNWDSNAAIGQNSRGLLQVIPDTFRSYALPGFNTNIYDPLSNILAGLNYMIHRYGGIENVVNPRRGHWRGYAVGTRDVPFDMLAMIHEGEAILPKHQNPYSKSGGNYLREIGDKIGSEVISSAINLSDDGYVEHGNLPNYSELSTSIGTTPTQYATSSGSQIKVEVNVGTVNNQGDLDNLEEKIVTTVTNAINRAAKATGGVKIAY